MSWWGTHPVITRAEARRLLPPGACRLCVAYVRAFPARVHEAYVTCTRCGNPPPVSVQQRLRDRATRRSSSPRFVRVEDRSVHVGDDVVDRASGRPLGVCTDLFFDANGTVLLVGVWTGKLPLFWYLVANVSGYARKRNGVQS